jgi:signal transduction histidine kinase
MMVWLAVTGAANMRERAELALEGRVLRLSHDAERELRDRGLAVVSEVMSALLKRDEGVVRGLSLSRSDGTPVAAVGQTGPPSREVQLFVGPAAWGGVPVREGRSQAGLGRGHGRGRMLLRVFLDSAAARAPLSARLLAPATAAVGVLLVVLAAVGGKLLVREERRAQERAEQRRLVSLGRAGAGLAHQLRTPLATVKGSCQLLLESQPGPAGRKRLRSALEQCERMEKLLGQLLDYTRPPQSEPEDVELGPFLERVASGSSAVVITTGEGVGLVDPEHLRQILENLVDNATKANDGGNVEISSSVSRDRVEISVKDRGPGPGEDPENLFEPYVTTRSDGIGLGLPIARALAEANGGTLTLAAREGGGCQAVLLLPAAKRS